MKKTTILATLLFGSLAISGLLNKTFAAEPPAEAHFGFFYSNLSPYGEWIEFNDGAQVWRPFNLPPQWRPYSLGRWEWTDEGWYWISDEPFGWIVYHYGRWYYDDFYGWVWMPDDVWAPSWVEWRSSDDCIGWAPLPPYAVFDFSLGLHYSRHWRAPEHYWSFVRYDRFTLNFRRNDFMNREDVHRVFGSTRDASRYEIERGHVVNRGFAPNEISRLGNIRIEQRMISERQFPGEHYANLHESKIEVYRPAPAELHRPLSSPNFRKGERPLSGDFHSVSRMQTPASRVVPGTGSVHPSVSRNQKNALHQEQATVKPQKERRQQLMERHNRDRNTGPALHQPKMKSGRRE